MESLGESERECGERIAGGIYMEYGISASGRACIEQFLVDPPCDIPESWRVTPVGVTLVEDGEGVTHVVDWVGSNHYPNIAGFVEEARRQGVSRRLPSSVDTSKLTGKSRLILLHSRAQVLNYQDYPKGSCPKCRLADRNLPIGITSIDGKLVWRMDFSGHGDGCCSCVYWDDLEPGSRKATAAGSAYEASHRPGHIRPVYAPGVFMVVPIKSLAVIEDPLDPDKTASSTATASRSSIKVNVWSR